MVYQTHQFVTLKLSRYSVSLLRHYVSPPRALIEACSRLLSLATASHLTSTKLLFMSSVLIISFSPTPMPHKCLFFQICLNLFCFPPQVHRKLRQDFEIMILIAYVSTVVFITQGNYIGYMFRLLNSHLQAYSLQVTGCCAHIGIPVCLHQ